MVEVMQQHPELNTFGIGAFDANRKTREQQGSEVAEGRSELLQRETTIMQLVAWLKDNIAPIQTPTQNSYPIKGYIERARGEYISNGELIAAALIVGYSYKYVAPNVLFGMSQRDVDRVFQMGQ